MNTKNTTKIQHYSRGAVSLFVVIFTSLLFVTITVGFTILMLSNQQQSTDNDLAQSALDSAQAGTEDAKRVLAQLADCEERDLITGPMATADCIRINQAVSSNECNTINRSVGASIDSERLVKTTIEDEKLEQAYTCVKINTDTDSYIGKTKGEDEIRVIPLRSAQNFSHVRVSWLLADDMSLPSGRSVNFSLPTYANTGRDESNNAEPETIRFPTKQEWLDQDRAAVLRLQTIQYRPGTVNLNTMDNNQRSVFLYPNDAVNTSPRGSLPAAAYLESAIDLGLVDQHHPIRPGNHDAPAGMDGPYGTNKPQLIRCDDVVSGYMCSTDIVLPQSPNSNFSYLTLASFYRETSFMVELIRSDGTRAKFNNVQPEIDATGRANDVFRRVVSRVESADANQAPYPRAELGTNASMCKNYVVTDDPDDFHDYTTDEPTTCPNIVSLLPVMSNPTP